MKSCACFYWRPLLASSSGYSCPRVSSSSPAAICISSNNSQTDSCCAIARSNMSGRLSSGCHLLLQRQTFDVNLRRHVNSPPPLPPAHASSITIIMVKLKVVQDVVTRALHHLAHGKLHGRCHPLPTAALRARPVPAAYLRNNQPHGSKSTASESGGCRRRRWRSPWLHIWERGSRACLRARTGLASRGRAPAGTRTSN